MAQYSQFTAYKALLKASLKSILKSPSSVVFTVAFPLIFIVALGWLKSEDPVRTYEIGVITDDSAFQLQNVDIFWTETYISEKGNPDFLNLLPEYDAIIRTHRSPDMLDIWVQDTQSLRTKVMVDLLKTSAPGYDQNVQQYVPPKNIDNLKQIDYILPGQLGFSLLAASVFGTAFIFFGLRSHQVLKRCFATPIKPLTLLLAEGSSRLIFQIFGSLLLIAVGHFFFEFSLASGWLTVALLLLVSALSILCFMSFGFVISGLARSESTVPPLANIIVMPQFILSDTFIPINDLPGFISKIGSVLPLTHLNQCLRHISTHTVQEMPWQQVLIHLTVISIWGIIGYLLAMKTFRWE